MENNDKEEIARKAIEEKERIIREAGLHETKTPMSAEEADAMDITRLATTTPPVVNPSPPSNEPPLGRAVSMQPRAYEDSDRAVGWKPVPLENLPSGGLYYPTGTKIEIRSANVAEVRDFSMIDENDAMDVDDRCNNVISRCCRLFHDGRAMNWKDLKEEDRFYLLFCIRELTFVKGENKISIGTKCGNCGHDHKLELRKEVFSYFKIDDKLMNKYDYERQSFVVEHPLVGRIELFVPSIGVTSVIKSVMKDRLRAGIQIDRTFLKISPFLFRTWQGMSESTFKQAEIDSLGWSNEKLSALMGLSDMIKFGVKTEIKTPCEKCGAEVAAPLSFPGGIKQMFLISGIVDDIL